MIRLIGLNGKKKRGKDTAYSLLTELTESVHREGFADRLKLSALRCFNPNATLEEAVAWADKLKGDEYFVGVVVDKEGSDEEEYGSWAEIVTGREFLQYYGTEAHRDVFAPDFWVDQVLPPSTQSRVKSDGRSRSVIQEYNTLALERRFPGVQVLVITDVRFPNEAKRIKEYGGEIWEIIRPELDEQESGDAHASEQPLARELVDKVIINDGSLEDFKAKIANAWEGHDG